MPHLCNCMRLLGAASAALFIFNTDLSLKVRIFVGFKLLAFFIITFVPIFYTILRLLHCPSTRQWCCHSCWWLLCEHFCQQIYVFHEECFELLGLCCSCLQNTFNNSKHSLSHHHFFCFVHCAANCYFCLVNLFCDAQCIPWWRLTWDSPTFGWCWVSVAICKWLVEFPYLLKMYQYQITSLNQIWCNSHYLQCLHFLHNMIKVLHGMLVDGIRLVMLILECFWLQIIITTAILQVLQWFIVLHSRNS